MSNFPSVKPKKSSKSIVELGFYLDHKKESYAIYKDSHRRRIVIPIHAVKDLE